MRDHIAEHIELAWSISFACFSFVTSLNHFEAHVTKIKRPHDILFQGLAAKEGSNRHDGLHGMPSGHQSRRRIEEELVMAASVV